MGCDCKCKCGDESHQTNTATTNADGGQIGTDGPTGRSGYTAPTTKAINLKGLWGRLFGSENQTPVKSNAETKLTASQKITDLADWFNYPQREQFLFNSEINEPMNGSSNSVDHINPVEVQGSEDIMGAESFNFPFQHKNADQQQSGDGRRWISHGGKMVATTFPEGTTPDNWFTENPITYSDCGAWETEDGRPLESYSGASTGVYKIIPTYLMITKSWCVSHLGLPWPKGCEGIGKWPWDSYYPKYRGLSGKDTVDLEEGYLFGKISPDAVIEKAQSLHQQGDSYISPVGHSVSPNGCPPYWFAKKKFIFTGKWIDETGELKVNGQTWEEHKEEVNQAMEGADFDRRMQMEKEENKKPKESDYDYHARQIKIWEKKLKQGHAREEVQKYFDYHEAQMAHYSKGKGGRGKSARQQVPQAPHQPGQAPMGGPNMFNTEQVIWPQFTQNISGQGRTFANTIHPGMVIPNPDNYPTPEANNPWAPYVNIRTYGDILNAVYPPYPSAMEWATNPENYKEYPSTDWYTP